MGEIGKQHKLIWKLKDLKIQTQVWLKERKLRTKAHIKNLEEEITECIHKNSTRKNWMAQESLVKELESVRNKILLEKEEY